MKQILSLACMLFCAIGTSAGAQTIGTYYGTSADGQFLDFTVGTDPNTSSLALTGSGINFDAPCKSPNPDLMSSWGFGFTQDIADRKVTMQVGAQDVNVLANMTFSRDGNTVSGAITSRAVAFVPFTSVPSKGEFCESSKQAFTATLSTASPKRPLLAPGEALHYPAAAK